MTVSHPAVATILLLSLMSMARIFGKIWYYLTLWAWGTTTLLLVSIVWTGVAWTCSRSGTVIRSAGPSAGRRTVRVRYG